MSYDNLKSLNHKIASIHEVGYRNNYTYPNSNAPPLSALSAPPPTYMLPYDLIMKPVTSDLAIFSWLEGSIFP